MSRSFCQQYGCLLLRPRGPAAPVSYPLLSDLNAFWELEEASGTRTDAHTNELDLTDNNTVTTATGKVGEAALFTQGNSEYLSRAVTGGSPLDLHGEMSLALWYYPLDTSDQSLLYGDRFSADPNYALQLSTGTAGRLSWFYDKAAGGRYNRTGGSNLTLNAWNHIVAVRTAANELNLYLNGALNNGSASGTAGTPHAGATAVFVLGRGGGSNGTYLNGRLDQVGVWERALTEAEVAWLYGAGNGRSYAQVAAYTG